MKKFRLTAFAAMALMAQAEVNPAPRTMPDDVAQQLANPAPTQLLPIASPGLNAEGYYEFTYADFVKNSRCGVSGDEHVDYHVAILLNNPDFVGYKIYDVKIYGYFELRAPYGPFTTGLKDFSGWLSDEIANKKPTICQKSGEPKDGVVEIMFDQPYEITDKGVAVGYDFSRDQDVTPELWSKTSMPVAFSTPKGIPNSMWMTTQNNVFSDFSNIYGASPLTVYMKKENQTVNNLRIDRVYGKPLYNPGDNMNISFMMTNLGTATVNNITYRYEINGQSKDVTYTLPKPMPMNVGLESEVSLNLGSLAEGGLYDAKITILKVNGEDNVSNQPFDFRIKIRDGAPAPEYQAEYTYGSGATSYMGMAQAWPNDVAMKIVNPALSGMKIVGIKVSNLLSTGIINYRGWITNELTSNMDNLIDNIEENVIDGTLTCYFDFPVTLTDDGVWVGYSFVVDKLDDTNKYPIPYFKAPKTPNSMWLQSKSNGWVDYSETFGPATITVLLQGDIFDNGAVLGEMTSTAVMPLNEPCFVSYELVNKGTTEINNIDYSYVLDNDTPTLGYTDIKVPAGIGRKAVIEFPLPELKTKGTHPISFVVTKVNGLANTAPGDTMRSNLCVPTFDVARTPLLEEFTGLWCGWCTRGWLAMKMLNEQVPGFVGAAYHYNDAMEASATLPLVVSSYPSTSINRYGVMDPYFGTGPQGLFGIKDDYLKAAEGNGYANLEVKPQWNDDYTQLDVNLTATFGSAESKPYKLGLIIINNDLSNPDWVQQNYYAGTNATGPLKELSDLPHDVTGMVFNEVVVNADYTNGILDALPALVELDKPYSVTRTFDMVKIDGKTGCNLVEDKDKIEVIAVLINDKGKVVNCVKVPAGEVGINDIITNDTDAQNTYYDMLGRRVSHPDNGIFIRKAGNKATKIVK